MWCKKRPKKGLNITLGETLEPALLSQVTATLSAPAVVKSTISCTSVVASGPCY